MDCEPSSSQDDGRDSSGEGLTTIAQTASISIVVLTHNRCHLLRDCVQNVLARTSSATREIVIWDNASTDGTAELLGTVDDPRITVVRWPRNIGVNAYARAFPMTSGSHLIELDDDVVDAPRDWDAALLDAFESLPEIGYLAASLAEDPYDVQARLMYELRPELYRIEERNGIRLKLDGPVGGWCGITSRELHDRTGGWRVKHRAFWEEEGAYLDALDKLGFGAAYLDDLRVRHAGGPHYAAASEAKLSYLRWYGRRRWLKNTVKTVLLAIPFISRLNERKGWFNPPREGLDYVSLYTSG